VLYRRQGEEVPVTTGTGLAGPIAAGPSVPQPDSAVDLQVDPEVVPVAPVPVAGTAIGVGGSLVVIEALHRAAAGVRHHVEQAVLRGADLSWTGYAVLALTCEERSVETRAAAAAIGISRGTLTGVVRTLESKNLVRRVPHCRDGRLVLLEPTATGRRLARRLAPQVAVAEEHAIGCLDGTERDTLAGLLCRLVADLNLE
jgi:DNA-binding MarR family transcriptional regulator